MANRCDISFYRDLLRKPVVDRDGRRVGTLLDLSAAPAAGDQVSAPVRHILVRPARGRKAPTLPGDPLILPWGAVSAMESRRIRLTQPSDDLAPAPLETGALLLSKHVLDQQVLDVHGVKLRRVNDVSLGWADGQLHLAGMETGLRGLLTRLGDRWGLVGLPRPLSRWMGTRLIAWATVARVDPARGQIRLRLTRDEVWAQAARAEAPCS